MAKKRAAKATVKAAETNEVNEAKAVNTFTPTAANIIASLGIKGASVTGGEGMSGYVPVLNEDGRLDVSTFDAQELTKSLDVAPLTNLAYVDYGSTHNAPTGSSLAPFKSLKDAMAKGFGSYVIVGTPGDAENVSASASKSDVIRIFSTSETAFGNLTFTGLKAGQTFVFWNINANAITFSGESPCKVVFFGRGTVGSLVGTTTDAENPTSYSIAELAYSAEYDIQNKKYVASERLLDTSARVANSSTEVQGTTVSDATTRLGQRTITVTTFTSEKNVGLVEGTKTIEVTRGAAEGRDDYALTDTGLAEAANSIFHKDNDSPVYQDVTAATVTATSVEATSMKIDSMTLGDSTLIVDADGFLVVKED